MKSITLVAVLASTAAAQAVGKTTLWNLFDEDNDGIRNNNASYLDVEQWIRSSGIDFAPIKQYDMNIIADEFNNRHWNRYHSVKDKCVSDPTTECFAREFQDAFRYVCQEGQTRWSGDLNWTTWKYCMKGQLIEDIRAWFLQDAIDNKALYDESIEDIETNRLPKIAAAKERQATMLKQAEDEQRAADLLEA